MRVRKQLVQIAHCMHLVLDYEHNTDNSKGSTHYHKYDTANSQHRTLNYGGERKHFEHNTTNNGCITHHYEHSKLNCQPKTANSESHRTNSR